jgi:hypothetical protein
MSFLSWHYLEYVFVAEEEVKKIKINPRSTSSIIYFFFEIFL